MLQRRLRRVLSWQSSGLLSLERAKIGAAKRYDGAVAGVDGGVGKQGETREETGSHLREEEGD